MRHEEAAYNMGYRVTEDGRVMGLTKERKLQLNPAGYYQFSYVHNTPRIRVHRLQAYQKFGAGIYEPGMVVRHLDGNPKNNSVDNIELGTNSQNQLDVPREERLAHARHAASFLRVLTDEQVIAIRTAYANGARGVDLAKQYNTAKSTISGVCCGKFYPDVAGPITPARKCVRKKKA